MGDPSRELQFKQMTEEFPDSPMGWFSLGRYYLTEGNDPAGAAGCFAKAVAIDANYSAAHVALGDAYSAMGEAANARAAWNVALQTPHARKDGSLRGDLEERLAQLEG